MTQDDFFQQAVQITKAHGYDILAEQVKTLQAENETLKAKNKELQHHYDTTRGLWATDRPDLITDPQKILFQL